MIKYEWRSKSLPHKGLGNDAMSRALNQISKSPFTRRIEGGKLSRRFTQPTFIMYIGRTDPIKHVSHFNQRMVVHSRSETLMCKVFLSSLGPVAMRWFDGLREGSIRSFKELTRAFGAHFVTCSKVPRPLDSFLFMAMREGETLKTYSDRYWKMFNEIDGDFDDMTIRILNVDLPAEHDLRKSLTRKLVRSVRRLMDRIDEYKQVEEDQQQGKGKAKVVPQDKRDLRSNKYNNSQPRRDFAGNFGSTTTQVVSTVFREPVHQILKKSRTSHTFNGQTGWGETPRSASKVFNASTTRNEGTLPKIVGLCGATWSN